VTQTYIAAERPHRRVLSAVIRDEPGKAIAVLIRDGSNHVAAATVSADRALILAEQLIAGARLRMQE
jgi:hypothetical protein